MDVRTHKFKLFRFGSLLLIVALILAACASPAAQPAETTAPEEAQPEETAAVTEEEAASELGGDDAIVFAFSGPLTGPFADEGIELRNGFEMAIEDWNSRGGVLGREIDTLIIDDQVEVEPAVAGAQRAVEQNAVAVAGFLFSNVGIAARPTYTNNNIIFAPTAITAGEVISTAEDPDLVFRTIGLSEEVAGLTAKYMLDVMGLRRVAVLHDRDDWGRNQAVIVQQAFDEHPEAESVMFEGVTVGESEFSGLVTNIIASEADSVYFAGHHQEQAAVINQLREAGWEGEYVGPDSLKANYPDLAGENAEGTLFIEGAGPTMIEAGQEWAQRFAEKYGHEPRFSAMTTYVSTDLVLRGIEAVGNADDRRAIVEWIRDGTKDTIMGTISFNEIGEIQGFPWVVERFENGEWVVIARYNAEADEFEPLQAQ